MYHLCDASIKSGERAAADYCVCASRYLPGSAAPKAPSTQVNRQSGPKTRPDINPVAQAILGRGCFEGCRVA